MQADRNRLQSSRQVHAPSNACSAMLKPERNSTDPSAPADVGKDNLRLNVECRSVVAAEMPEDNVSLYCMRASFDVRIL
jgi:hypothetical protein